jgi:hypothetical protein
MKKRHIIAICLISTMFFATSCSVGKRSEDRLDLYRSSSNCGDHPENCDFDIKNVRFGEPSSTKKKSR